MNRPVSLFLLLICSAFCFPACAGLSGKISKDVFSAVQSPGFRESEAGRLLYVLKDKNRDIKTFKGTGRIKFSGKSGNLVSADIAWVAEDDNKISLVLRDILGRPIARISADGEWIYFVSHADNTFYKKHYDNAGLENFISIPVRIKDFILLLSGRIPVYEFDSAAVTGAENGECVLILKKKWSGVAEKIYFGGDCRDVAEVEIYDTWGDLLYKASFEGEKFVKEYNIPSRLVVSDGAGDYLMLDIERCWADVPVSGSVFILNPPDQAE
ncbi:MAG: DUF4292 domain-containing protein [Desulfobacteraceae bacterium]|nr:MAG: DUF4292 domain-containing protein [Desulfobacteraceae bacterium]